MTLDAHALHDDARRGRVPREFVETTATLREADAARERAREALHSLIREAHANGVGTTKLAQWSGYSIKHVTAIVRSEDE